MPRNLYNRVELVIPVEDEAARTEMLEILDLSLADDTGCWILGDDGKWSRREAGEGRACDVQQEMIDRAKARAAEAVTAVH